ncbi:MAG: amidohydrolase family protein [Alphaproteobacteria bacterium]|nr:amidohydrolase family protein [Alphaproteobacteria bacterium]
MMTGRVLAAAMAVLLIFAASPAARSDTPARRITPESIAQFFGSRTCAGSPTDEAVSFIDTHSHLNGVVGRGVTDFTGAAETAIAAMEACGIELTILMAPPFPSGIRVPSDIDPLREVQRRFPGRFVYLGGGGSLSPMIIGAAGQDSVSDATRAFFEARAEQILRGGASGFGELTALHFSFAPNHPYIEVAPDHPLFLLLADIAARHDVPIDLHMEAADTDIDMPLALAARSRANPASVDANEAALERLLAHNRDARIVWTHFGWDNTGRRTVDQARRLLDRHANLYLSIKIAPDAPINGSPLTGQGDIHDDWLALFSDFPERFVVGVDQFHASPRARRQIGPPSITGPRALLDALPADLARRIGVENARAIYNLD